MNFEGNYQKCKTFFIGIGGISRAGKSTLVKRLCNIYNVQSIHFDRYLIAPIEKYDENIKEIIKDWEDPACYNIEKFKDMLSDLKEEKISEKRIFIVEGFLIYSRKDITDILDCRILLDVEKEIARERRKRTKDYPSDYYYDEYIWKGFKERNIYFPKDNQNSFVISSNQPSEEVFINAKKIIDEFLKDTLN